LDSLISNADLNLCFVTRPAKDRLSKLGQIMNYMHPWTGDYKVAIDELQTIDISLQEGAHLEFEMLDLKQW
jgi:hypothetical protein